MSVQMHRMRHHRFVGKKPDPRAEHPARWAAAALSRCTASSLGIDQHVYRSLSPVRSSVFNAIRPCAAGWDRPRRRLRSRSRVSAGEGGRSARSENAPAPSRVADDQNDPGLVAFPFDGDREDRIYARAGSLEIVRLTSSRCATAIGNTAPPGWRDRVAVNCDERAIEAADIDVIGAHGGAVDDTEKDGLAGRNV